MFIILTIPSPNKPIQKPPRFWEACDQPIPGSFPSGQEGAQKRAWVRGWRKLSKGKDIGFMKSILLHEEEKKEEEQQLKEELKRLIIKTIKRFNRTLYLKKKNIIVNSYPILSQKNEDITVISLNKFREKKRIFISKKIAIEKVTSIKEEIM